jgi:hypothetical protein
LNNLLLTALIFITVNYFLYSALLITMTLPEVCPLDENQKCKGRECHLFCLEWRTREPTCLIGYSTTSKVKSWKDDRKQDTYAEETFRKLGRQPAPRKKSVSEKGDWIPTRLVENPQGRPVQRKEERSIQDPVAQKPVREYDRRPQQEINVTENENEAENKNENETEKAFIRLGARLKKEPAEEKPIIYGKTQTKLQEKPKVSERVVSSNKHTTIFTSTDKDEKKDFYPPGKEEGTKKSPENKEKRKKFDEVMEIDTPEIYDEEFWS